MKLVRSARLLASSAFLSATMSVHGKPHGIKDLFAQSALRASTPETPPATIAVASSPKEETHSWLRRWLMGSSHSSSSYAKSPSKSASGDGGSTNFAEHCLVTCEESGGVAAGDIIVPPASVEDWKDAKESYCCDGGASYLKVVFEASYQTGLLTFDADIAAKNTTCDKIYDQTSNIAKKSGESSGNSPGFEIRFVSCDDPCLLSPFGDDDCLGSFDTIAVQNGTEVCFAAVDPMTDKILFNQKMGTNIYPFFIPFGDEACTLAGVIHASCSTPIVPPYAAIFYDPCGNFDEENLLINLNYYSGNIPYLAFLDGISTGYYESALNAVPGDEDLVSYQQEFDITFGNCGCTCETFLSSPVADSSTAPSVVSSPGPSSMPSGQPVVATSPPTYPPTGHPTSGPTSTLVVLPAPAPIPSATAAPSGGSGSPGPGIVPPGKCPSTCSTSILQSCFFGDNVGIELAGQACDINANIPEDIGEGEDGGDDGRRRLRMLEYHYARIEAIESILARLD
jgi:hypothetical protein